MRAAQDGNNVRSARKRFIAWMLASASKTKWGHVTNREELRKMKQAFVYILASKKNGTIYTSVTSDLARRVYQHKHDMIEGFTKKYGVHLLVWFEVHDDIREAIQREKQIKYWQRKWKLRIIEETNPEWRDLYDEITG